MSILEKIKNIVILQKSKRKWRKTNSHNLTSIVNNFDQKCVNVGKGTYGSLYVLTFNPNYKLSIGNFCSIANDVKFLLSCDHCIKNISTYPYKVLSLRSDSYEAISDGDIIIDDDVWICENVIILSGVHIGQGAVIAAGAVVSKDVPPYAVVGGIPAKVIKYRFPKEVIKVLLTIDYSRLTEAFMKKHIAALYKPLNGLPLEQVKNLIEWMPKKNESK